MPFKVIFMLGRKKSREQAQRIHNLEERFATLQKDLTRVGGGVPELTDSARGLELLVNEKDP